MKSVFIVFEVLSFGQKKVDINFKDLHTLVYQYNTSYTVWCFEEHFVALALVEVIFYNNVFPF